MSYAIRVAKWENVPSDMCAQRSLKSACAYAQSDQNFVVKTLSIHKTSREDAYLTARMRRLIWIFEGRTCPSGTFPDSVAHMRIRTACNSLDISTDYFWISLKASKYFLRYLSGFYTSARCCTVTWLRCSHTVQTWFSYHAATFST